MMFGIDLNPIDDIVSGVFGVGGDVIGDAFKSAFTWVVGFIVSAFVNAARHVIDEVFGFFDASSTVSLTSGWWTGAANQALLGTILRLTVVLMLIFLLLAVLDGLWHGNPGEMVRAAFVQLPLSAFGTATLIAFTTVLLGISDYLSAVFLTSGPGTASGFDAVFADPKAVSHAGVLGLGFVLLLIVGGVVVWIELLIRESFIYYLIPIAYFLLAARIWRPARAAWHKVVGLGLALIFAKPCIALALALGRNALAGSLGGATGNVGQQTGSNLSGMLIAAVLMLLAMFSPFVLLKLMPIAEAAVVGAGVSRGPVRGAQSAAQTGYAMRMLGGRGHGSGGTASGVMASGSGGPSGAGSSGAAAGSAGPASSAAGGAAAAAVSLVVAKAGWDRAKNSAENASDLAGPTGVRPVGTTATVERPADTADGEVS
jgi:hypothetical protein